MNLCVCVCLCVNLCESMSVYACVSRCACVSLYVCECVSASVFKCESVFVHLCMPVSLCVCLSSHRQAGNRQGRCLVLLTDDCAPQEASNSCSVPGLGGLESLAHTSVSKMPASHLCPCFVENESLESFNKSSL